MRTTSAAALFQTKVREKPRKECSIVERGKVYENIRFWKADVGQGKLRGPYREKAWKV